MRVMLRVTGNLHNLDKRDNVWHEERINTNHIIRDYLNGTLHFIITSDGVRLAVHPDDVKKLRGWFSRLFGGKHGI